MASHLAVVRHRQPTPAVVSSKLKGGQPCPDPTLNAGPKPTREKLVAALNGIARMNIGSVMIDYSPTDM